MRIAAYDPTKLEETVKVLDGLYRHRVEHPIDKTDELYYKLYAQYLRNILHAKARVEQHEGFLKEEKYRLVMFFEPPMFGWKLLDWMERAHGATFVAEPAFSRWGPGDFDPSKPLEALADKTFLRPVVRQQLGRIEPLLEDMLIGAKEYHADGVLTFCHVGCRQTSSCNRRLKDVLMEEAGLPFFAVEHDIADPAFVSEEEMRDKVEGFLEMIDERRKQ